MDQQHKDTQQNIHDDWIRHQRTRNKTTSYACALCLDRKIFTTSDDLWHHAKEAHPGLLPTGEKQKLRYRSKYEAKSALKRPIKEEPGRKPSYNEASTAGPDSPPPTQQKRPMGNHYPVSPSRSLSELLTLSIGGTRPESEDTQMRDVSDHNAASSEQPRKRPALGDGILAGSASPVPFRDSESPPRRSEAKPTSAPYGSPADTERRRSGTSVENTQRPRIKMKTLWTPDQDSHLTRTSFDPSNIASIQAPKSRKQGMQPKARQSFQLHQQATNNTIPSPIPQHGPQPAIFDRPSSPPSQSQLKDEVYDIVFQPETRPISQEQLVAEVKGIYAGLVMVEAKCIEVDNKQATLASADPAYSMMALLYETVPAFEDTWIECLGDLGRYRMAIEDDDIRDREVWTSVARRWYSKASDKAPTTGRLYHHLAILTRPNALQQLFYYSKSLCVAVPFTSARESLLTLFDPVLNADNSRGKYRLPALDTAFVKAHGLLFTNKDLASFDPAVKEFLGLLDNQIGRVTRKFMEQGYHIAVANCVAMLGFASKDNVVMRAITDQEMDEAPYEEPSDPYMTFKNAERLTNSTLHIVLQRIGDPNLLPFMHVTLVFMHRMAWHRPAVSLLRAECPWELLSVMLNTLLASETTPRTEISAFLQPEKEDLRPFPENFAIRGLLWADDYFPKEWFTNEKIDEEEKYHERASMTAQRKERILWLGLRLAGSRSALRYDSRNISSIEAQCSSRVKQRGSKNARLDLAQRDGLRDHPGYSAEASGVLRAVHRKPGKSIELEPTGPNSSSFLLIIGKVLGALRALEPSLRKLAFASLVQVAKGYSNEPPVGRVEGCEDPGTHFWKELVTKIIRPETLALYGGLPLLSFGIIWYDRKFLRKSTDKAQHASDDQSDNAATEPFPLLTTTIIPAMVGILAKASDERVTGTELAPYCAFTTVVVFEDHSKKFARFKNTGAAQMTISYFVTLLFGEIFRYFLSPFDGRYDNPWAFHMLAVLPDTVLVGWLYEAFVVKLGFADKVEARFSGPRSSPLPVIQPVDGSQTSSAKPEVDQYETPEPPKKTTSFPYFNHDILVLEEGGE